MSVPPGSVGSPEWFGQMAAGSVSQLAGYVGAAWPYVWPLLMGVIGIYAIIKIAQTIVGQKG